MAKPKPAPASTSTTLELISTPKASVTLDGRALGSTPIRKVEISLGAHSVEVSAPGYLEHRRQVMAKAGWPITLIINLTPKPRPKPTPKVAPPKVAEPKKPTVPTLALPARLTVPVLKPDGRRHPGIRSICIGVERVIRRAMGKSADGVTARLRERLYETSRRHVTLYPRAMGYVIALGVVHQKRNIGSLLLKFHQNGRLGRLAAANWRP